MDDSSSVPTAKTVQCPRCKRFFASTGFLNRRIPHGMADMLVSGAGY